MFRRWLAPVDLLPLWWDAAGLVLACCWCGVLCRSRTFATSYPRTSMCCFPSSFTLLCSAPPNILILKVLEFRRMILVAENRTLEIHPHTPRNYLRPFTLDLQSGPQALCLSVLPSTCRVACARTCQSYAGQDGVEIASVSA